MEVVGMLNSLYRSISIISLYAATVDVEYKTKYLDALLVNQTARKALPPTVARSRNRKMMMMMMISMALGLRQPETVYNMQ